MTEQRKIGLDVLENIPWGSHICNFYETKQDLIDILVPYFKAGLGNNEFCVWVVQDSELITVEEAKVALKNEVPDFDRYLLNGAMEILNGYDWYLEENRFSSERVTKAWKAKLKQALALGYDGMRVSGDTFWLSEKIWKDFIDYEKQVNNSFTELPMRLLCTYPLAKSGAADILDVVQAHQFAITRRQGAWEIVETPELAQAKAEIKKLNEELEQRVVERTKELAATNLELRREIAERKYAEALLHAKEQEFRAIVENAPDQITRYDREFRRVYVNPELARVHGLPAEALINKTFESIVRDAGLDIKEDKLAFIRQQIKAVFDTGKSSEYEITWPTRMGLRSYNVRLFPELDLSGSVTNVLAIARDITEYKEAIEEIKNTNEQLRLLTAHLQSIREEERKRIGGEIHDELGQQLTAIKMDVAWIDKKIPEEAAGMRRKLKNIIALLDGSNQSIKRILSELRPRILDDHGLLEAIEWMSRQFSETTGIPVQFTTLEKEIKVPAQIATSIFRVCQEAFTNITRYARAKNVSVSINSIEDNIILIIEDDGIGFDTVTVQNNRSFGILGMKERVLSLGGQFELVSSPGKGTKIIIKMPYE